MLLIPTFLQGTGGALPSTPSQSTNIVITGQSDTTMSLSWTPGSGANRIVIAKVGPVVDGLPVNTTTYTANAAFGSGSQIGTGNYVVYNASGSTVTITGLTANTQYTFRVYDYNGGIGTQVYQTAVATDNPLTEYSFTTEYQAVIARAGVRGFATPTIADQIHDNRMLRRLKSKSIFSALDYFQWWGSGQDFGKLNWVSPSTLESVDVNSPTFTQDEGISGNGTSSYRNTSFVPSAGVNFTQNDAAVLMYVTASGTGTGLGSVSTTPLRLDVTPTAAAFSGFLNSNTAITPTNNNGTGLFHVYRTVSNAANVRRSLAQLANTGGGTTNGRSTASVYAGARHNTTAGDVADSFGTQRTISVAFGSNLASIQNHVWAALKARYGKFKPLLPTVSKVGVTAIEAFGDSFTVGQAASPIGTEAYLPKFIAAEFSSITPTNNAVSGKGAWVTVNAANTKAANSGTTTLWMELTGQNDLDRNGDAPKTLNKLEAMVRVLFVNHAATSFIPAGDPSVVKTGNYSTVYNASTVGGRSTTGRSNAAGTAGTVEYTFSGTAIGVQLISDSGVAAFGTCGIYIDGVLRDTVDLRTYYDNISDGTNSNQTGPVAFWYTGLPNTTHTIKVQSNADGICPVDVFMPLMDPSSMKPIIFSEIPLRLTYINGSDVKFNNGSARKLSIVQAIQAAGYSVAWYSVNKYYDRTDVDVDGVHPANGGHSQIASGYSHLFDGN